MKKIIIFFFLFIINNANASYKETIIQNLLNTQNLTFDFEQNINEKVEKGKCTIDYPKKIFCEYNNKNKKILVSNGASLVIKTSSSFYKYPIDKTPLNFILDKEFLIEKIKTLDERIIGNELINFTILENENEINLFFHKENLHILGWQILDIYQNLSITYLYSLKKNQKIKKGLFKLPIQN